jgi:hypothetical protein
MRTAVCLSGQPRKAFETFPYIYENILKPNNADVFIHMNYDKDIPYIEKLHMDNGTCRLEPDVDKKIIELYKPKRYLIEPPRNFQKPNFHVPENRLRSIQRMNSHKNWTTEEARKHFVKQMTSMYYSISKANELKELYANENGFTYDYVIRLRFDFLPEMPFYCARIDNRYIHYMELGQPDNLISDWFNVGSNAVMNVYASLYLHMDYLNTFLYYNKSDRLENNLEPSDICGGVSEHMLRDIMTLHKIPAREIHYSGRLLY